MSTDLIQLRNSVEEVMRSLCLEGKPHTNEIIAAVRKQHPNLIRRCEKQLVDVGLRQLVGDVRGRRPRSVSFVEQPNLPGLPEFIPIPVRVGTRSTYKTELFGNATIREVRAWLAAQTPTPRPAREVAVVALLEELAPYITSDNMTINAAIVARDKAEKRKKG
jgi:hypothetical protein